MLFRLNLEARATAVPCHRRLAPFPWGQPRCRGRYITASLSLPSSPSLPLPLFLSASLWLRPPRRPLLNRRPQHAHLARIRQWEEGNFEGWSAISYPDGLQPYIQHEFARIKAEQARPPAGALLSLTS